MGFDVARRGSLPAGGAREAGSVVDGGYRLVHQRVGLDEGQRFVWEGGGGLVRHSWAVTGTRARPTCERATDKERER